jgi:hypothetical protein
MITGIIIILITPFILSGISPLLITEDTQDLGMSEQ